MVGVRRAVAASIAVLVALLAGVSLTTGLTPGAWGVGVACGVGLAYAVVRGATRGGRDRLGPADLVTLTRATLGCAVAALVADASSGDSSALLVAMSTVALALDAVDGRVARATRTQSGFGARFDGEADAFLILVLSVHVAAAYGGWVLAIGAARFLFGAGGLVLTWLRGQLPPRRWRKVVAAVQGIVLVIAAADVLHPLATSAALAGALVLLTESFGHDVLWLWRRRRHHDDRAAFASALEPARQAAYPPGEYVGQESFMRAAEIRALARRAGVAPGVSVVDLCCGVAGPGRLITAELGCCYLGVDASPAAVELARGAAGDLPCRFEVSSVPPLPDGPFDVVLLLETLLAFREKGPLLEEVASALRVGGRFAFTVEAGPPLTSAEQAAMPAADTVWPVPMPELVAALRTVGLEVGWTEDLSRAHRATADALADAFLADRAAISSRIGGRAVDDLVVSHRLWSSWLRSGRIRKVAVVATRTGVDVATGEPAAAAVRCPG